MSDITGERSEVAWLGCEMAAKAQVITCNASRCIWARERRRVLQVRVSMGAHGDRPGSFVVLYGTTQSDIAVQDTEHSARERSLNAT
jgi:hypothetical protein